MSSELERAACTSHPVDPAGFNPDADLPYGLAVEHIRRAMTEFTNFLGYINAELNTRAIERLESMLMEANFSSMVGEFMGATIPKYCTTLVKNHHHNGHPDLVPKGHYEGDAVLHGDEGVEIKGSRRKSGWQGHNPEDTWLMVFVFDSNTPKHAAKGSDPKPFRFLMVVGARIARSDWKFSGRSATSRRTITASVTKSGRDKMLANWIYKDPSLKAKPKKAAALLEPRKAVSSERPASE